MEDHTTQGEDSAQRSVEQPDPQTPTTETEATAPTSQEVDVPTELTPEQEMQALMDKDPNAPRTYVKHGNMPWQMKITKPKDAPGKDALWEINYKSTMNNDIAALAAAKFLCQNSINVLDLQYKQIGEETEAFNKTRGKNPKKKLTPSYKKYYKDRREKYQQAAFGIGLLLETIQDAYVDKYLNPNLKLQEVIASKKEENNTPNEVHPDKEPGGDSAASDSPSGSEHQAERSE